MSNKVPETSGLAALLAHAMAEANVTQAELSRRTGIPNPTINTWLRGTRKATDSTLLRALAEKGGLPITVRDVFAAVGRPLPAPDAEAKARRLVEKIAGMTEAEQRIVEATTEAILANRAS